jgi:hypothetical protein
MHRASNSHVYIYTHQFFEFVAFFGASGADFQIFRTFGASGVEFVMFCIIWGSLFAAGLSCNAAKIQCIRSCAVLIAETTLYAP